MSYPNYAKIVEVGPRDGLQNEKQAVPVEIRIDLINRLSAAGLPVIESGAFVSPKWVPQMAASREVLLGIEQHAGTNYPVLVPNLKGYELAIEAGVREIAVFAAASESFSMRNINCSIDESLERFSPVIKQALEDGIRVRGYVSCVLGCPYEGPVSANKVREIADWLIQSGCYEVSLGDTIGTGTAGSTAQLIDEVKRDISTHQLAVHFHDTCGQALSNILVALQNGINVIDSSVAGLGGCPYAKGASGNVATEDVLYLLQGLGIDTGVHLDKVIDTGLFISEFLNRVTGSKAALAISQRKSNES